MCPEQTVTYVSERSRFIGPRSTEMSRAAWRPPPRELQLGEKSSTADGLADNGNFAKTIRHDKILAVAGEEYKRHAEFDQPVSDRLRRSDCELEIQHRRIRPPRLQKVDGVGGVRGHPTLPRAKREQHVLHIERDKNLIFDNENRMSAHRERRVMKRHRPWPALAFGPRPSRASAPRVFKTTRTGFSAPLNDLCAGVT
jgi:hypothetical protein